MTTKYRIVEKHNKISGKWYVPESFFDTPMGHDMTAQWENMFIGCRFESVQEAKDFIEESKEATRLCETTEKVVWESDQ